MERKTIYHGGGQEFWGKIQVFTGDGKGKTTAALGTALRAHAIGKTVVFIYFDKGGDHYSEEKILNELGIEYYRFGLDRIDSETSKFRFGVNDEDKVEGGKALEKIQIIFKRDDVDVLVLDELNVSVSTGIIIEQDILDIVDSKPEKMELIITGRDAPQSLIDKADLVSRINIVKHYFYKAEPARKGLDY